MNRWLHRAAGTAGIAGGLLLFGAGAAHAEETVAVPDDDVFSPTRGLPSLAYDLVAVGPAGNAGSTGAAGPAEVDGHAWIAGQADGSDASIVDALTLDPADGRSEDVAAPALLSSAPALLSSVPALLSSVPALLSSAPTALSPAPAPTALPPAPAPAALSPAPAPATAALPAVPALPEPPLASAPLPATESPDVGAASPDLVGGLPDLVGGLLGLAGGVLDPAGGVLDPAGGVLDPAGDPLDPAGALPGAPLPALIADQLLGEGLTDGQPVLAAPMALAASTIELLDPMLAQTSGGALPVGLPSGGAVAADPSALLPSEVTGVTELTGATEQLDSAIQMNGGTHHNAPPWW